MRGAPHDSEAGRVAWTVGEAKAHARPGRDYNRYMGGLFDLNTCHLYDVYIRFTVTSHTKQCPQDAYCLAERVADLNRGAYDGSLSAALQGYERTRKPETALVLAKSVFVGAVETLGGAAGEAFRDNFFFGMWKGGVAERIFMDGAMPKV